MKIDLAILCWSGKISITSLYLGWVVRAQIQFYLTYPSYYMSYIYIGERNLKYVSSEKLDKNLLIFL